MTPGGRMTTTLAAITSANRQTVETSLRILTPQNRSIVKVLFSTETAREGHFAPHRQLQAMATSRQELRTPLPPEVVGRRRMPSEKPPTCFAAGSRPTAQSPSGRTCHRRLHLGGPPPSRPLRMVGSMPPAFGPLLRASRESLGRTRHPPQGLQAGAAGSSREPGRRTHRTHPRRGPDDEAPSAPADQQATTPTEVAAHIHNDSQYHLTLAAATPQRAPHAPQRQRLPNRLAFVRVQVLLPPPTARGLHIQQSPP